MTEPYQIQLANLREAVYNEIQYDKGGYRNGNHERF